MSDFTERVNIGWGTGLKVLSALVLFTWGAFTPGDRGYLIILLGWGLSTSADADVLNERLKAIQRRLQ